MGKTHQEVDLMWDEFFMLYQAQPRSDEEWAIMTQEFQHIQRCEQQLPNKEFTENNKHGNPPTAGGIGHDPRSGPTGGEGNAPNRSNSHDGEH